MTPQLLKATCSGCGVPVAQVPGLARVCKVCERGARLFSAEAIEIAREHARKTRRRRVQS